MATPLPERAPAFERALLKVSGEALLGGREYGIDPARVDSIAREIVGVHEGGVELALVVGAGNIVRGMDAAAEGMDRATADYAGMLATLLNALAVQDALERHGAETRLLSAITVAEVAEPYIRRRAIRHLEKGRVVVFAAGTGNPFFTSDTAAALRAAEIDATVILMAKNKVDGVYDADPRVVAGAKKYHDLTYQDLIEKRLAVMDTTAAALAGEREMPIIVFDISERGAMRRAALGERVGTLVHAG